MSQAIVDVWRKLTWVVGDDPRSRGGDPVRQNALPGIFAAIMVTHRMWSLLKEFFRFCLHEKKWWLAPLIVLLLVLGVVIVVASSTPIATLIYSIF